MAKEVSNPAPIDAFDDGVAIVRLAYRSLLDTGWRDDALGDDIMLGLSVALKRFDGIREQVNAIGAA